MQIPKSLNSTYSKDTTTLSKENFDALLGEVLNMGKPVCKCIHMCEESIGTLKNEVGKNLCACLGTIYGLPVIQDNNVPLGFVDFENMDGSRQRIRLFNGESYRVVQKYSLGIKPL